MIEPLRIRLLPHTRRAMLQFADAFDFDIQEGGWFVVYDKDETIARLEDMIETYSITGRDGVRTLAHLRKLKFEISITQIGERLDGPVTAGWQSFPLSGRGPVNHKSSVPIAELEEDDEEFEEW